MPPLEPSPPFKLCANISMLFTQSPMLERIGLAKQAGFGAVECQFPYEQTAHDWQNELNKWRVPVVLHNLPAGAWAEGERGIACLPDRKEEFRDGVHKALEYARALACPCLNCLAGIVPSHVAYEQAEQTFIENLQYAAPLLAEYNIKLLIEPINHFDIPCFFLTTAAQAYDTIQKVKHDNLFIQWDIYHAQRMHGNLAKTFMQYKKYIAHIQIADSPDRHEPLSGEINYRWLLGFIAQSGYQGWIGCEYNPKDGGDNATQRGLGWIKSVTDGRII